MNVPGRRLLPRPLLALAVALAAFPAPSMAHIGDYSDMQAFATGPYSGSLGPGTDYFYSGQQGGLLLLLVESEGNEYRAAAEANVTWQARLGDQAAQGVLVTSDLGKWLANVTFPATGVWNVTLAIDGRLGSVQASVAIQVYPDIGYRFKPVEPLQDPPLGEPTRLAFRQAWRDEARNGTIQLPADGRLRLERWSEDHKTLLSADEVPATAQDGALVATYTFPELGMYHLKFASEAGGFGFGDMPTQHVYVLEDETGDEATGVLLWGGIAALGLVGLTVAAVQWRRRQA